MNALKRRILNTERKVFQQIKKTAVGVHYRLGVTRVLPPVSCQLEITSVCNYNCVMCNRNFVEKERKNKLLSLEDYRKILANLPLTIKHIFFMGQLGDAFCHPSFYDFLDIAKERKYNISVATNGERLTKERTDRLTKYDLWRLHVSLDSTDKEMYSNIRGGDVDAIVENLKYFKEKNPHTSLFLAMVLMKDNVGGIDGFLETARRLKADLIILQMMIPFSMEIWAEQSLYNYPDKMHRAVEAIKNHMKSSGVNFGRGGGSENWSLQPANGYCDSAFSIPQILVSGDVVPCCMVSNASEEFTAGVPFRINPANYIIGNVKERPLMSIWNNKKIRRIRKEIIDAHNGCEGRLKGNGAFGIEDFAEMKRSIAKPRAFDYCKVCALRWQVGG